MAARSFIEAFTAMRSFRLIIVTMFALGALAACHRSNTANNVAQTNSSGQTNSAVSVLQPMMGNRPRLRIVCAGDIQRFCQGNDRVGRCLRQNIQSLGADCRTALQQVIALARERRMQRMNSGNYNNGGYNNSYGGNNSNNSVNGGNAGSNTNGNNAVIGGDDNGGY
jgi:hypothetical protein